MTRERTNCSQIQGNALPAHLNFTMKGGATEKFNKFEFCGADRQKSEFIHLGEIIGGNKKATEAAAALYCCDENHLLQLGVSRTHTHTHIQLQPGANRRMKLLLLHCLFVCLLAHPAASAVV